MICFPNAKINLGLRIVEKRPDGYHNLETVFYPIGLKDALEVVPHPQSADYSLSLSGISAEESGMNMEKNLVTRAFRILQAHHSLKPSAYYLKKAIPTGAGLGGGSSDAANALIITNLYNDLGLSDQVLMEYSAQIGADCAFFIKNKPIFATGIGNVFEDFHLSLHGFYLVLVKPDLSVSTAEAYSLVQPKRPDKSLLDLLRKPIETWKETIVNDFEPSVFSRYPLIGQLKDEMYRQGAVYACMSGSGSSVFGLFRQPVHLKPLFRDCFYWSEILE
jgi:4-diphosphocytidyl-2-C-methyl-D-erythritol kinase